MTDLRCASCGAVVERSSERLYCGHCGARVAAGVADLEAYRTGPERFDRVEAEPAYRAALQHAPALPALGELAPPLGHLAVGLVVIAAGAVAVAQSRDWQPAIALGGLAAYWLVGAVRGVVVAVRRVASSTQRLVAIVTGDRFRPGRRGGGDPSGTCAHRVTLRARDGEARDVFAPGELMGEVAVGDIGIAYLRHDRLVDYRQFDVMAPPLEPGEVPRAAGCTVCGAHPRFGPISDRCAFCGAALPAPDLGEFGTRFRAAAASTAARDACERPVRGGVPSLLPPLALLAAGVMLGLFALDIRDLLADLVELSRWFVLLAALFVAPLLAAAVWLWRRTAPHRAGRRNELAVLVRKRAEVVRARDGKTEYRHFATIAGPSGVRRELQVMPSVVDGVTRGQIGVAHLRGEWLAGFTPLPV